MSTRQAVTDAEKLALQSLVKAMETSETFSCAGTARNTETSDPLLMYMTGGLNGGPRLVMFRENRPTTEQVGLADVLRFMLEDFASRTSTTPL